jgi:hypothetical protein
MRVLPKNKRSQVLIKTGYGVPDVVFLGEVELDPPIEVEVPGYLGGQYVRCSDLCQI